MIHDERNLTRRRENLLVFALLFLFVAIAAELTPMQSDDYGYGQMGISLSRHLAHYLGWSGRLVADFTSSAILSISRDYLYKLCTPLALVTLCYLWAELPAILQKKPFHPIVPVVLLFSYVVFNPNLGQTTFWVVGAANYVWTNFYIGLFLLVYFSSEMGSKSDSLPLKCTLIPLGVLAGCGNENTAPTLFAIVVLIVLVRKFFLHEQVSLKWNAIYLTSILVGAGLLLLAPGNYVRLQHPAFQDWRSLSIVQKVYKHIRRSYRIMVRLFPLYAFLTYKVISSRFWDNKEEKPEAKKLVIYAAIFFLGAICSVAAMVFSPSFPRRAFNGTLCFLMLSLSFALHLTWTKEHIAKIVDIICFAGLVCVFTVKYIFTTGSYYQTSVQFTIRNDQISYQKALGHDQATIPQWYFSRLLDSHDAFDYFHSGAMASYCGMQEIDITEAGFNYAAITTGEKLDYIPLDGSQPEELEILYLFEPLTRVGTLVVKIPEIPMQDIELRVVNSKRGEPWSFLFKPEQFIKIKDHYYAGVTKPGLKKSFTVQVLTH